MWLGQGHWTGWASSESGLTAHSSPLPLISCSSAISGSYPSISSPDPSCALLQSQEKNPSLRKPFTPSHSTGKTQHDQIFEGYTVLILRNAGIVWLNRLYYFGARQSTYCVFFCSRSSTVFTHAKISGLCEDLRFGCSAPPWDGWRVSRWRHQ